MLIDKHILIKCNGDKMKKGKVIAEFEKTILVQLDEMVIPADKESYNVLDVTWNNIYKILDEPSEI